jgi:hypothetical protein
LSIELEPDVRGDVTEVNLLFGDGGTVDEVDEE